MTTPLTPAPRKHPPATMEHKGRSNYKHIYQTGRRGNIWFEVYTCPACGFTKRPASNPLKGRKIVFTCTGENAP